MMFHDDVPDEQMDAVVQQHLGQNPAPSMQEERNGLLGQGVQVLNGLAQILQGLGPVLQEQTEVLGEIATRMDVITAQMGVNADKIHAGLTAEKVIRTGPDGKPAGITSINGDLDD